MGRGEINHGPADVEGVKVIRQPRMEGVGGDKNQLVNESQI